MSKASPQLVFVGIEPHLDAIGYQLWGVESAEALYRELVVRQMDIAIIDMALAGGDGFGLIEHLSKAERYGLIAITGQEAVSDRVRALNLGADLCLTRPLDWDELEAAIHAVRRRMRPALATRRGEDLPFPWLLDSVAGTLQSPSGERIALTSREVELMRYLMSRSGEVIDKESLLLHLAGSEKPHDFHRIESILYRVRKKAERAFGRGLPVRSVFGRGLTFAGSATVRPS